MGHTNTTRRLLKIIALLATVVVLGLSALLAAKVHAAAGIYKPFNYQGKLTNTGGIAITNGTYNMKFKVFSAATSGVALWTETWDNTTQRVTSTGGLFSIQLGTHVSMTGSVNFNTDSLYLQVEFDPGNDGVYEEVFSPRRRFASVPYARNADTLDGLDATQFIRSDTSYTASGTLTISPRLASRIGIDILSIGSSSATGAPRLSTQGSPHILFGSGGLNYDTNLYRSAANTLKTDDAFSVVGTLSGNTLVIAKNAVFSNSGIVLAATGGAVFNENSNNVDFRIESDTDANAFFLDASTDRIGIGTNGPKATLDVLGTASGTDLYASNSISGSYVYVNKTFGGAGLVDCDGSTSKLLWDATTKKFSCGTATSSNWSNTGSLQTAFDSRYVNTSGDTMTGALTINLTSGFLGLKIINTASGNIIHTEKDLTSSGTLKVSNTARFGSGLIISKAQRTESIRLNDTTNSKNVSLLTGSGSPEGIVAAGPSSMYFDNGSGRIYKKNSGTSVSGWVEMVSGSGSYHMAKMYRGAAQSIPDATFTKIAFDGEEFDVGNIADYTTNDRFDIKKAGKYLVTATWRESTQQGYDHRTLVYKNGTAISSFMAYDTTNEDAGSSIVTDVLELQAGDYLEMYVYQDQGLNAAGSTHTEVDHRPRMSVIQLMDAAGSSYWTASGANIYNSNANNVGIGTDRPGSKLSVSGAVIIDATGNAAGRLADTGLALEIIGTASGRIIHAQNQLRSSGTLIVESGAWIGGTTPTLFVDSGNTRVGIGTNAPKATLAVLGTASGTDLYASNSISGAYVNVGKTFGGAGLVDCDTAATSKLLWDATTKRFSCGTDQNSGTGQWSNTGSLKTAFDSRYVNVSGDTMTGTLKINLTSGTIGLNVLQTFSGDTLFVSKGATLAGTGITISASGQTVFNEQSRAVDFRIESDGDVNAFFVDASANGIGIGKNNPKAKLDVVGTISGSTVFASDTLATSGSLIIERAEDSKFIELQDKTNNASIGVYTGSGSPEGAVSANKGSLYSNHNDGRIYKKNSGTGNTGWTEIISGSGSYHMAKMTRDAAQSIAAGSTPVKIAFDAEEFDVGNIADFTTNDRFDIKKAGKYLVTATVALPNVNDTAGVWAYIYKNGSSIRKNGVRSAVTASIDAYTEVSDVLTLSPGDYIEMFVAQDTGSSQNTYTTAELKPRMSVVQLMDANGSSFWTSSGSAIYNSNAGNVGIGTDRPGSKLSVSGAVIIDTTGNAAGRSADTGLALEIIGTASGRVIHAQNQLRSSGTLIVESGAWIGGTTPTLFVDSGNGRVGIGTNAPKAALAVLGTASGTDLYASNSISGSYVYVNKTFAGAGLVDCDTAATSKLLWDATTKRFSCGTDQNSGTGQWSNTGSLKTAFDSRYVNTSGDTMTGTLKINLTSGTIGLNVLQTFSGDTLFVSKGATLAGTGITISASGQTVFNENSNAVDFRIESDTKTNMFFVDASTDRIGIGTNGPENTLEVVGSISGTSLQITGTGSRPLIFTHSAWNAVGIGSDAPTQLLTVSGGVILNTAGGTPKTLSGINIGGTDVTAAAVIGRYAYVGVKSVSGNDFRIIDVSDPYRQKVVGGVDFGTGVSAITVAGKYAYVGTTSNAAGNDLRIIDISNPNSPKTLSGVNVSAGINSIFVAGKYAYLGTNTVSGNDFRIIDIANPLAPRTLSGIDLYTNARSVYVSGKYAYVAHDSTSGNDVRIIDVSNPSAPTIAGGMDIGTRANGITVIGRYAYVVNDGLAGSCTGSTVTGCEFRVYDVSNPASPSAVGGYSVTTATTDRLNTLVVTGRYGYVGGGTTTTGGMSTNDVRILDVSNATAPVEVGSIEPNAAVASLAVAGKYMYAGLGNGDGTGVSGVEFLVYDLPGLDAPTASIGTLGLTFLNVSNDAIIDNVLSIGNALNVGVGGIKSDGTLSISVGSGASINAMTGAIIINRGQSGAVLLLDASRGNNTGASKIQPHILFGYKGQFDTNLYRSGTGQLATSGSLVIRGGTGRTLLKIESKSATQSNNLIEVFSDNGLVGSNPHNRVFRLTAGGDAFADGSFTGLGADYAERFKSSTPDLKPGEAVCLDPAKERTVRRCDRSGDSNIMGVVSTKPAFVGDRYGRAEQDAASLKDTVVVGLIGQLPAKAVVEGTGGTITIGDSLTAAAKPGFIRKAKAAESTVGVALSGLSSGTGAIDVLITRKNASDLVAQVEQEVAKSIASMNIQDEIAAMVAQSRSQLNLSAEVSQALNAQLATLNLASRLPAAQARFLTALNLSGSVLLLNDNLAVNGTLHVAALTIDQGLQLNGPLTVNCPFTLSGSSLTIGSLMSTGSLKVLGDVTISGLATFLGPVQVQGELIVSGKQAGYALVRRSERQVTVRFSTGFTATPVVTTATNDFVFTPWRVKPVTQTGFTIELAQATDEDLVFSWLALATRDPQTAANEPPHASAAIEFPVDADGVPVSSREVWNACIRNHILLDDTGQPLSCSRYHNGHDWEHPDLHVSFIYDPDADPPVFILPDGYQPHTVEESPAAASLASSASSSSGPAPAESSASASSSSSSADASASSSLGISSVAGQSRDPAADNSSSVPPETSQSSSTPVTPSDDGEVIDLPTALPPTATLPQQ